MPKPQNNKPKKDPTKRVKIADFKSIRWVLNNIDDDQLALIDSTPMDIERLLDWVAHIVDHGLDLKIGWDDYSKCYQATLTCMYEGFINSGYAMSARSDDMVDLLKIIYGKFELICIGDMSSMYEQQSKRSRRG